MRVAVNGIRLFFEVEGAKLVPDGPRMREQPTLVLLHGGPASRHREHPSKLILLSGAARENITHKRSVFERLGGRAAADVAERFWQGWRGWATSR